MGAWATKQVAAGKTMREAFDRAVADAEAEYGHQEGYSGALNSKGGGFIPVALPPRMTVTKLLNLLEEYHEAKADVENARYAVAMNSPGGAYFGRRGAKGNLRKAEVQLRRANAHFDRVYRSVPEPLRGRFAGLLEAYHDKWGDALGFELRPTEASRYRVPRRRGEKLFAFAGYAPC